MKSSLTIRRRKDGSISGRATGAAAQALFDALAKKPADSGGALQAAAAASEAVRISDRAPKGGA